MKPPTHQGWWARQPLRRKLILVAVAAVVVIGLAVGLGVGLTQGGSNGSSPSSVPSSAPSSSTTVPPAQPSSTNKPTWTPSVNSTWQIVLQDPLDLSTSATTITPDVSIYDIDLFTNSKDTITTLHKLNKKVICYFSAGSYEPNRPDASNFTSADKGATLDGWPDEKWLDLNSTNVRNIMAARIQLAADKGCDAIDPDNIDGYQNNNGLNLTPADSISFLTFLSTAALTHNLSMGLKNAGDIVPTVLPLAQFSVNEQCVNYAECESFAPFITAGKPVFHIEYPSDAPNLMRSDLNKYCGTSGDASGSLGFSTVLKKMSLDGWVEFCNGVTATTGTGGS
ncbi:glycoside hydrolase family 114 protein [Lepidopterella palustris CBS 459.81]|uniref:alpha-galactosidase n=1 Tax=Lepidopterella palustris CBS 459.81 TaxID=1314670 RepID=A0A8E2JJM1_9PEZI|nr:glycoside hydrolase family 114 protein [Lepidopterella palustris CBS 459.81]